MEKSPQQSELYLLYFLNLFEQAFELAITTKEKELYYLKDATHIQTYYKESVVKEAIEKLDIFYK